MNPIFYILLLAVLFIVWVALSILFPIMGKLIRGIYHEVKDNINR